MVHILLYSLCNESDTDVYKSRLRELKINLCYMEDFIMGMVITFVAFSMVWALAADSSEK